MRTLCMVLVLFFLVSPVWAKEIAGVAIKEKIVNPDGVELLLNGAGIRKKLFFKIYVAELYLQHKKKESSAIVADEGAKRMVMYFLYDEVGRDKIVDGWKEGFTANVDAEKMKSLQSRIDSFNALFDQDMVKDDSIVFDYLPGKGTRVEIKGVVKGLIEGKDFSDALLSIWLGKEPVSSDLREELLGQ